MPSMGTRSQSIQSGIANLEWCSAQSRSPRNTEQSARRTRLQCSAASFSGLSLCSAQSLCWQSVHVWVGGVLMTFIYEVSLSGCFEFYQGVVTPISTILMNATRVTIYEHLNLAMTLWPQHKRWPLTHIVNGLWHVVHWNSWDTSVNVEHCGTSLSEQRRATLFASTFITRVATVYRWYVSAAIRD